MSNKKTARTKSAHAETKKAQRQKDLEIRPGKASKVMAGRSPDPQEGGE